MAASSRYWAQIVWKTSNRGLFRGLFLQNFGGQQLQVSKMLPMRYLCSSSSSSSPFPGADIHAEAVMDQIRSQDVQFSPMRESNVIELEGQEGKSNYDAEVDQEQLDRMEDDHLEVYQTSGGSVSLHGIMETNVPQPFGGTATGSAEGSTYSDHTTSLNMPRGSWSKNAKYLSDHLTDTHQSKQYSTSASSRVTGAVSPGTGGQTRSYSDNANNSKSEKGKDETVIKGHFKEDLEPPALQKLKLLARDYGPTVIVIHIAISLTSLGCCYLLVESGFPIVELIMEQDWASDYATKAVVAGGNFVIAYAIHKMLMPLRVGATILTAPVAVGWLRRKGILKPHAVKK